MTVAGLSQPTVQSMAAGNPRDSAIANNAAMNAKQNDANRMAAGGKKKRGGSVTVPQFTMPYAPTGGPGQDPNSLIAGNSKTSTQASANSVYDQNALKGGRSKRRCKGGNPDWKWGCSSGGKRKTRKTRKIKTRRRKSRKYRR
jgi:hypothetical protein